MHFLPSLSSDSKETLVCPHCGFDHLHHRTVVRYDRNCEDAVNGRIVRVADESVLIVDNAEMTENLSPRRGSVSITFDCEGCGRESRMHIIQHKGQTFLELAAC